MPSSIVAMSMWPIYYPGISGANAKLVSKDIPKKLLNYWYLAKGGLNLFEVLDVSSKSSVLLFS